MKTSHVDNNLPYIIVKDLILGNVFFQVLQLIIADIFQTLSIIICVNQKCVTHPYKNNNFDFYIIEY